MHTALYPGSFDPVTIGHADIIKRASALFSQVIVGVLHNPQKPAGVFTAQERAALLRTVTEDMDNVSVRILCGLLVDAVRACGADAVVRSVRDTEDLHSEIQMARLNRQMRGTETLFIAASPHCAHISSSYVRDIGRLGGELRGLVPEVIRPYIADRLQDTNCT